MLSFVLFCYIIYLTLSESEVIILDKDFNAFLSSIDNKQLMIDSTKYLSKSNYSDDSEKQLDFSVAIAKSMLKQYHQWLNS
jgi:hypothetical protein